MDIKQAKKISIEAVKSAGKLLMDNFNVSHKVSFKNRSDIVTDIDVLSEKIIIDKIKSNFPDHYILAEESGFVGKENEYLWTIDPLDGTINYYCGCSPFRIGLCLLKNKAPIMSVIYNPVKDDLYYAEKGKGAFLNGKKIKVSDNAELSKAVAMSHLSSRQEFRERLIKKLDDIYDSILSMRFLGSADAAASYIASGKFEIFFELRSNSWDILPGTLLVQEAGGKVTDITGKDIDYNSTSILATNGKLHDGMLRLLKGI